MKQILPKLISSSYKGQNGRLAVIGGSLEYSGAPFYSSISQLKGGCDLAHIFCTKHAAIPIKAYSPEVITHPYLESVNEEENTDKLSAEVLEEKLNRCVHRIEEWEGALDSFVIGPGLGRDKWIESYLGRVIATFSKKQIIVLDADALWYFLLEYQKQGDQGKIFNTIISINAPNHILTPNQAEFERTWKVFMNNQEPISRSIRTTAIEAFLQEHPGLFTDHLAYVEFTDESHPIVSDTIKLAKKLNNVNIIHKGMVDVITNGIRTYVVLEPSSLKRCGGIGDILSGLTGLYCFWAQRMVLQLDTVFDFPTAILHGCVLSCCITRRASYQAFLKYHLSLTAPNVIEFIGPIFKNVYELYLPSQKL